MDNREGLYNNLPWINVGTLKRKVEDTKCERKTCLAILGRGLGKSISQPKNISKHPDKIGDVKVYSTKTPSLAAAHQLQVQFLSGDTLHLHQQLVSCGFQPMACSKLSTNCAVPCEILCFQVFSQVPITNISYEIPKN